MRLVIAGVLALASLAAQAPENVYRGELLAYPGPWAFQVGKQGFVVMRDDKLEAIAADPDRVMNLSTGRPRNESLRQICERAKARGFRTLSVAFDHFFAQYRPGQETPRSPDAADRTAPAPSAIFRSATSCTPPLSALRLA